MRNIPVFTTQHGVASLVLKEVPNTQVAYIHLRSSSDPGALLDECKDFCRAVGAKRAYATGEDVPKSYPLYTEIIEMRVFKDDLPDTESKAFPVQEEMLELWRAHYNERMKDVPNAAWMDKRDAQEMLENGRGYFVQKNGALIGIGMVRGDMLMTVASLRKGTGQDTVLALCRLIQSDTVRLEVASTNQPAICLYKRLGFLTSETKASWYKIF